MLLNFINVHWKVKRNCLHVITSMNAIVMMIATVQKRCDKPVPISSRFSWFFTIIGVIKKLKAIPIWVPKMLNDVAVESSLAANHCAARRPGNVRIIVWYEKMRYKIILYIIKVYLNAYLNILYAVLPLIWIYKFLSRSWKIFNCQM